LAVKLHAASQGMEQATDAKRTVFARLKNGMSAYP
jgi:hypothetical protein